MSVDLEPRRYVGLTREQAAYLGDEELWDWEACPDQPWLIAVPDLVALRRDALRWRRLCRRAELGLVLLGGAAATGIAVAVLAIFMDFVR